MPRMVLVGQTAFRLDGDKMSSPIPIYVNAEDIAQLQQGVEDMRSLARNLAMQFKKETDKENGKELES